MKWLKPVADTQGVMVSDVGEGCRVSGCHGATYRWLARGKIGVGVDNLCRTLLALSYTVFVLRYR